MRNSTYRTIFMATFVIFWGLFCVGQSSGKDSRDSVAKQPKPSEAKEQKRRLSFAGYPVILYTPETSIILGGGAAMTIRDQRDPENARPDNMNFYAIYTLKKQFAALFNPDFYFHGDKWQIKTMLGYQKFPDLFYGIGNSNSDADAEDVTTEDFIIRPALTCRVYKNLRLGATYHFNHTSIQQVEPDGKLSREKLPGSHGSLLSGLGPIIEWDSRDNIFYPAQGSWLQFYATVYRGWLGSEFDYESYTLDFRYFLEVQNRHILAFQLVAKTMQGLVPFNHLARLDQLRGIHGSRFRDQQLAVAQVEYRYPIYRRFSGVLFTGVGDVMHRSSDYQLKQSKFSLGVGLRFAAIPDDKLNLRLDVGFSRYGINPYFQLSEAF